MSNSTATAKDPYSLDSVTNALKLLTLLRDESTLGVAEVSRKLNIARSTAHRLLTTLRSAGFVEQISERAKYKLGPVLQTFSPRSDHLGSLVYSTRRQLERLVEATGETCQLNILEGRDVLFIDGVEGPARLRVSTTIGERIPANSSAGGKAQLAQMPAEVVRSIFSAGLEARTPATVIDIDKLLDELAEVKRLGYATNLGENLAGMNVIGAPIIDRWKRPVAAVTVAGPEGRMTSDYIQKILPSLITVTKNLSEKETTHK